MIIREPDNTLKEYNKWGSSHIEVKFKLEKRKTTSNVVRFEITDPSGLIIEESTNNN